jgi:hypothetical protein
MSNESLEELYQFVILPQFGLPKSAKIIWKTHETIGPDDDAHYFQIDRKQYVLIFRDYDQFGEEEIRDLIKLPTGIFEHISPTSFTNCAPAYRFSLPVPFKYAHNVTGYFALLSI